MDNNPEIVVLQLSSSKGKDIDAHCRTGVSIPFIDARWYSCSWEDDFAKEIERVKPNLIVIESLNDVSKEDASVKRNLPVNYDAYPEIPRLGYLYGDRYSPSYFASYQLLRKFKCNAALHRYTINGESLFESDDLPIFCSLIPSRPLIPPATDYSFYVYKEEKIIPVGFFGTGFIDSEGKHYPWRQAVASKLINKVPFFSGVRPSKALSGSSIQGNEYMKFINRCKLALTCGTETNVFLNKHFEIPLAGTCLVTEKTDLLEAIGFRDMENCVFVDEENVLEKVSYLLGNESRLAEITQAGRDFIVEQIQNNCVYRMVRRWYDCFVSLKSNEKVVQPDYFSFRSVVQSKTEVRLRFGVDKLKEMNLKAYDLLFEGNPMEAAKLFNEVLEYVGYEPLARLGLAIVGLVIGKLDVARNYVLNNFKHSDTYYPFDKLYDPVDLAYLSIIFFCDNNTDGATHCLSYAKNMEHPSINAARKVITGLDSPEPESRTLLSRVPLNQYTYSHWITHFSGIVNKYKK